MSTEDRGEDAAQRRAQSWTTDTGATVCRLVGDLDLDTLDPTRSLLEEALHRGAPALVVDLAGVTFCDSSGLNLLLQIRSAAQKAGVTTRLASAPEQVARLLDITGASAVFSIHSSIDEALCEN
ncbi:MULTISPECIES: STAS domain-containing protein [unclassified Streptomyces]|uniref:STAS domain-containing protein n=1 Tax=unclassified Streptomyces TaxID=2593676 RepID=UPI00109ED6A0|nr:STAS domain-containing protein [Streptomyces sp. A1136]THA45268.1 anti-sigma factor antagonist [Streptomyces sp. A1136]